MCYKFDFPHNHNHPPTLRLPPPRHGTYFRYFCVIMNVAASLAHACFPSPPIVNADNDWTTHWLHGALCAWSLWFFSLISFLYVLHIFLYHFAHILPPATNHHPFRWQYMEQAKEISPNLKRHPLSSTRRPNPTADKESILRLWVLGPKYLLNWDPWEQRLVGGQRKPDGHLLDAMHTISQLEQAFWYSTWSKTRGLWWLRTQHYKISYFIVATANNFKEIIYGKLWNIFSDFFMVKNI